MRLVSILAALALALNVTALSAAGQGRGNGGANKKATQTTRTTSNTPKAHGKTQTTTQTTKAQARAAKVETRTAKADARAAKAETRIARADAKAARKAGTVATTTTTAATTTTATTTTTPTGELTPTTPTTTSGKNPKLEARLKTMLPADMTVQDAMAGFKNWGQFVAAVHVSNNLNIPFADLKAKMTGITPGPTPGTTIQGTPMSLGQAIQSWKAESTIPEAGTLTPTVIQTEVKKAEDAASSDLRQ